LEETVWLSYNVEQIKDDTTRMREMRHACNILAEKPLKEQITWKKTMTVDYRNIAWLCGLK
jgi:hypothetical protein